jgi:hypothetical protein
MALAKAQWLSGLLWISAIGLMLPPLNAWIVSKLPWCRNHFLKGIGWFVLVCLGFSVMALPPGLNSIAICSQLEKGICVKDRAIVQNQPKIYLTGRQADLKSGTEFQVKLEPTVDLKQQTVKAQTTGENYVIELEPKQLPTGKYKISLASANAKMDLPEPQDFTVWAGAISDLKLCEKPQDGTCRNESTTFVENTSTLYFSGQQTQLPDGTEIIANLTYQPEPKKSNPIQLPPIKAKVKDQQVLLEVQPKTLPIGTYELNFNGNEKVQVSGSKTFTVWRLHEEAKAIAENKFPESRLSLEKLSMCDRSQDKLPKDVQENNATAEFDETKTEKVDGKIIRQRRSSNFCSKDQDRFPRTAKAIGFQLDFDPVAQKTPLKIVWRFAGGEALTQPKAMDAGEGTNGVSYTFVTPDGLPQGEYELLLSLEAKNAKPIARKFTVE